MSNTETTPHSIKQRIKDGDKISHNKVPTNASREQVHEFIAEHAPDMIYLDAHHSPITEWDISRICQAGQEKDTPVNDAHQTCQSGFADLQFTRYRGVFD